MISESSACLLGEAPPSFSPPGFLLWEAQVLLLLYSLQESSQKTSSTSHHLTKLEGKDTHVKKSDCPFTARQMLWSSLWSSWPEKSALTMLKTKLPLGLPRGPALSRTKKKSYAKGKERLCWLSLPRNGIPRKLGGGRSGRVLSRGTMTLALLLFTNKGNAHPWPV